MSNTKAPFAGILVRRFRHIINYNHCSCILALFLFFAAQMPAFGQTSVLTQHNDNARTGQNTSETILNTTNVNVNQFGKLFALPVDGQVYAQPLYVPGVTINGGVHNVVIIATENDSVYAYDADSTSAVLLWKTKASLVDAAHGASAGETALNWATTTGCSDMQPQVGITSTPVIDPTSKTIYVEAKSTNGTNYFHRLHALDLLTGNEKAPGPVVIAATVSGTGDGSSKGQLSFDNLHQLNRPGLLLLNGTIYIAYASHCDSGPYHGWLFAYDAPTFTQKSVYVTTPNGGLGGFWMTGEGIAADASGNIFIASGNGDFDTTNVPARETGDTILKLGTTNQILTLLDYFTPEEQATLDSNDEDLGSGGVLLLPDQSGSFPHILVQAGKEGRIYVVNRDQMTTGNTHYCSGCSNDPEIIEESGIPAVGAGGFGMFNSPVYWNNTLYFWGVSDVMKSIPITNGLPDFTHVTHGSMGANFPGAGVSVSSNGTTAGSAIVWGIDSSQYGSPGPGPGPAILYAFDATNITTMLYSSAQNAGRDAAGNAVKFAVPTVANGKVYVGTSTAVDVYGLLGGGLPVAATPVISPASETTSSPIQVTITDSTSGSTIFYTTDNSTPSPTNGTKYTSAFTLTSSATVKAIVTATNFQNSAVASVVYTIGSSSTTINYSSGFTASGLALSGSAAINGTRLRLTDTAGAEAGSGFFSTSVNIQSFTTDFAFQLTSPTGDGVTFTIHGGSTAAALGPWGGGLGYGPDSPGGAPGIPNSVAVKFDLFSNAGEGADSTGIYTNGASPTVPSVDMTSSGVNLHSGDVFQVHMAYNGTNLAMTVTDASTGKVFSQTFSNINIPSVVGGNTAYVGFTGGTGGSTAIQEIITWTFSSVASQVSTPQISPSPGSYMGPVTVTITDATSGATITYTTDGSTPVPGSHGTTISSGGSFTLTSTATVNAIASASGFSNSAIATAAYTVTQSSQTPINFGSGFAGETTLTLNNGASINGTRLRLTDGNGGETRSAFNTAAVSVSQFVSDFTFQITNPIGDGFTLTIQGVSPTVLGPPGGGLGYGPDTPGGTPGLAKSVAIKFDLYNNAGEGPDSTGSYLNGASPTIPASDMTSSGVDLHSGDVFHVHVTYDGTTLAWSITDTTTGRVFSSSSAVNIPSVVGGQTAYVGFTGGTGGSTAIQEILTWTYSTSASAGTPIQFETESPTVFNASVSSGPTYRIFSWSGFTNGSGTTLDGTAAGQFVTITLNIPQAGTYDIRYATKKYNTRGIVQLSINGVNIGPAEDQYAAAEAWQELDLGTVTLGAGNQQLKFTTAGKNASSSGFTQAYDYIKLIPQ